MDLDFTFSVAFCQVWPLSKSSSWLEEGSYCPQGKYKLPWSSIWCPVDFLIDSLFSQLNASSALKTPTSVVEKYSAVGFDFKFHSNFSDSAFSGWLCVCAFYLIFNNKKWLLNKGYFPVRKRCYLPNFLLLKTRKKWDVIQPGMTGSRLKMTCLFREMSWYGQLL